MSSTSHTLLHQVKRLSLLFLQEKPIVQGLALSSSILDYKSCIIIIINNNNNTMVTEADFQKDLYDIVGVSIDATRSQLRKAYLKKSTELHPDKHPNVDEATKQHYHERFTEMKNAYDILCDDELRLKYDMYRTFQKEEKETKTYSSASTKKQSNTSAGNQKSQQNQSQSSKNYSYSQEKEWSSSTDGSEWYQDSSFGRGASSSGTRYKASSSFKHRTSSSKTKSDPFENDRQRHSKPTDTHHHKATGSTPSGTKTHKSRPKTFGTRKDGEPCLNCLRQQRFCYQHRHQAPGWSSEHETKPKTSQSSSSSSFKSDSTSSGTSAGVFGINQNGLPCKRCMKQGTFCYQHVHQACGSWKSTPPKTTNPDRPGTTKFGTKTFGVCKDGRACKRCAKQGGFCYQHVHQAARQAY